MSSEKIDTRSRILDAAAALLEHDREKAVRMSDFAKAAGISRQALYLHFSTRAELLIATTRHVDRRNDVDALLAPSRAATTGRDRLALFIEAWGRYIPLIYGVGRALIAMRDSDEAAAAAWADRMGALREGCEAAIRALARDGALARGLSAHEATDLLWTMLSVENWEQLTRRCGWSEDAYVDRMKAAAARLFVAA